MEVIRMVPFFFIHLLLMALLLQHTEEKKELRRQKPPKHDEAVHHQEFCLSIPEAPRSTGLDFETPQPPTSASKPKPASEKPERPKLPVQQPRSQQSDVHGPPLSGKDYPSFDVPDVPEIVPVNALVSLHSPVSDGCYCKEQNKKPPTETYRVSNLNIRYPSETCRSTEYIEILQDGSTVCVTQFSLVTNFFRSLFKPVPEQRSTESPEISSTTHQSTTAETSTPTDLAITADEPGSDMDYLNQNNGPNGLQYYEIRYDVGGPDQMTSSEEFEDNAMQIAGLKPPGGLEIPAIEKLCISCPPLLKWNNFDLKDVQLVDFYFPPDCPILISVSLTDGRHICMDSFHPEFQQLLDKLDIKEP